MLARVALLPAEEPPHVMTCIIPYQPIPAHTSPYHATDNLHQTNLNTQLQYIIGKQPPEVTKHATKSQDTAPYLEPPTYLPTYLTTCSYLVPVWVYIGVSGVCIV